jgi:membrane glycosyltransferase
MRGDALVRMVALMEKNRTVGILQTAPRFVLGQTLFQRVHQFAGRVYGPMFLAGMNFWQMDHGCFWGHNAIVRLRPFMKYCALPELPKVGALGGRLLSHDTVEAALMQKAGYGVWVAYDIDGSYEESPPDLLTNLKRNRRWCHGNMQHWLVLFWRGLTSASRTQILFGIFAYANAPLWFLFLIISTLVGFQEAGHVPVHHTGSVAGIALFLVVFVLLLLPKVLAVITVIRDPELKLFGGTFRLVASALGETIFTMLTAPVLMLAYTRFVFAALTGLPIKWGPQARGAERSSWAELWSAHREQTLFGVLVVIAVGWRGPAMLPWMIPVLLGLLLALPLSRASGSVALAERLRQRRIFLTPEEVNPPAELIEMERRLQQSEADFFQQDDYAQNYGLLRAILDPYLHSIHISLLRQREAAAGKAEYAEELSRKLLSEGPASLTPEQRLTLLWDAESLIWLHRELWLSPNARLHTWWQKALSNYNRAVSLYIRAAAT